MHLASPQFPRTTHFHVNWVSRESLSGTKFLGDKLNPSWPFHFLLGLGFQSPKEKLLDGLPASSHPNSCQEPHYRTRSDYLPPLSALCSVMSSVKPARGTETSGPSPLLVEMEKLPTLTANDQNTRRQECLFQDSMWVQQNTKLWGMSFRK